MRHIQSEHSTLTGGRQNHHRRFVHRGGRLADRPVNRLRIEGLVEVLRERIVNKCVLKFTTQ
jgi:hypothetical protein